MVTVVIGSSQRMFSSTRHVDEDWINEQLGRRHAAGEAVCVKVRVESGAMLMTLATPACAGSGGGGRRPNAEEQRIFELWNDRGLSREGFTSGNVIAFLHQLLRIIG